MTGTLRDDRGGTQHRVAGARLLEARAVRVVRAGRAILEDVDAVLVGGEFLGLIGPNGAGKTTLLRTLAGLEPASAGEVLYRGEHLATLPPGERARHCGYHAQAPELHWPLDVASIVALGRLPHGGSLDRLTAADRDAIHRAIDRTGLAPLVARRGDTLSGGELARVHMARLLAGEHRVLLADEPIANLDPRYQIEIMKVLREHAGRGGGVVVVLHDLAIAARYCDRLILLDGGRVRTAGKPHEVLAAHELMGAFGVDADYLASSGIAGALAARE